MNPRTSHALRYVARIGVAGLLASTALAPAAGASAPAYPRIAAITTIHLEHSASLRVVVPHPVTVDYDAHKSVSITGGGRLIYLTMTERNQDNPDVLTVLRAPRQAGGDTWLDAPSNGSTSCTSGPLSPLGGQSCTTSGLAGGRLHRGIYDLRVISDGPATITLHFGGLDSSVDLVPAVKIPTTISPFVVTLNGANGVAAGGDANGAAYPRSTITFFWAKADAANFYDTGVCHYLGSDGVPNGGANRWLPHCPLADSWTYGYYARTPGPLSVGVMGVGVGFGFGVLPTGNNPVESEGAWLVAKHISGFDGFTAWFATN